MNAPIRFGALSAARITPQALIAPAKQNVSAEVTAVAARDPKRAEAFAEEHGIGKVVGTYEELITSPDVDVIYNALPCSLHHEWTIKALRAGKHVLCEKPMASNLAEVQEMFEVAKETNLFLMEAFHWRYHPMAKRMIEICRSGALGKFQRIKGLFDTTLPPTDIRFDLSLGGGATMDLGVYPIQWIRAAAGEEPRVVSAKAEQGPPGIDITMEAQLEFSSGFEGTMRCSMAPNTQFRDSLEVWGENGYLRVVNPVAPHAFNKLQLELKGKDKIEEKIEGKATYDYQMDAFVDHLLNKTPVPTDEADSLANMTVVEGCYIAAGMETRGR